MKLQSSLLDATVRLAGHEPVLVLNSALDPYVRRLVEGRQTQQTQDVRLVLAEDSIANAEASMHIAPERVQHVAFHDYILSHDAGEVEVALMNLLYLPSNAWMIYGLRVAAHALRKGGRLYVAGAKERGILTIGKHMQAIFGNCETLEISKGQRVLCSVKEDDPLTSEKASEVLKVFAENQLDEGTRLLLDALEVKPTDRALDLGCGAGFIGLHIARLATRGWVTMVDVSLAAVATSRQQAAEQGLTNVRILPSDGARAVYTEQFDLVATNPPFHQGGLQTTEIAERFIRESAHILRPTGRLYLVANRFLKYEPVLRAHFHAFEEVGGNTKFKVLHAHGLRTR
ncbi:class I SAM-dependent methyltransferase [Ktedonobacter sp. SOSP1-85]|uniref:methyltransferase n=1 Tax=Ktedonobacter sp. SOSP1-85 TaxID=2778367 RepID=UPI001915E9F7|nr:class I SAM-dependent methyltransferase [Ktedonobacter sp. SOSP1-85]